MTLDGQEFIRRYLQYILPKGLMRIRHFGFPANHGLRHALAQIRTALQAPTTQAETAVTASRPVAILPCPHCPGGWLKIVADLAPCRRWGNGLITPSC